MREQDADVPAMVTALIGRRVRTDLPGTDRTLVPHASTTPAATSGKHRLNRLPQQAVPTHDDLATGLSGTETPATELPGSPRHRDPRPPAYAESPATQTLDAELEAELAALEPTVASIPVRARWSRAGWSRRLLRLALACMTVLTIWSSALLVAQPLNGRVNQLALSAFGLAAVWVLLASSQLVVVNLVGSKLLVRQGRRVETFHLASPYLRVKVVGEVGTRSWALQLERADGSDLVLAEPLVRSKVLHPVVEHHQAVADRLRAYRDAQFRR